MKTYKTIYVWSVTELLSKDEKVYCLDMETNTVTCLNEMNVNTYFKFIAEAIKDDSKYIFYHYEDVKEAEEENNG
ncbi:MAG: hypothetical protein IJZ16_07280 [Clostridia bacterium]|nr:hypothetical protein [Clostridia bacterium]